MRFVIDMNLSPQWAPYLDAAGHDAVHWSTIGAHDAKDSEIMSWAAAEGRTVLTSDLDFAALLAASGSEAPSVVQLRTDVTLPNRAGPFVIEALRRFADDLGTGALPTVDVTRARVRILPFDIER
jgi:predicted nuclease of predicted toxin-antitoxin system